MPLLNKIDLFGISMPIKVLGKEKHTSKLGGLLTILAITSSAVLFYYMGLDLWNRRNPIVIPNEITYDDPVFINLSSGNFPFMMNLEFFDGFNTPGKGFKLQAEYHHIAKDSSGNWNWVCEAHYNTLTKCNETSYSKLPYYKDQDLSRYFCMDFKKIESHCREYTKDSNYEVKIGGNAGDQVQAYLRISVINYEHDKDYNIINIEPDEKLYPNEATTKFNFRYPTLALNNQLINDPLKTISNEEVHLVLKDTFKLQWKWQKLVSFLDDKGWFGESITTTDSFEMDYQNTDFYNSRRWNDARRMFYRNLISVTHKEQQHRRRYLKVQDVIAISASFMKGIASICFLYVIWKGQKDLDTELVETIFNVEKKEPNKPNHDIKDNSLVSVLPVVKKQEDKPIPGFFSRIFSWCQSKSTPEISREQYLKAITYINEKLEVTSIVKLFDQFEKLKDFVLTDDQKKDLEEQRSIIL